MGIQNEVNIMKLNPIVSLFNFHTRSSFNTVMSNGFIRISRILHLNHSETIDFVETQDQFREASEYMQ